MHEPEVMFVITREGKENEGTWVADHRLTVDEVTVSPHFSYFLLINLLLNTSFFFFAFTAHFTSSKITLFLLFNNIFLQIQCKK
jgi:hypothetical protein